MPGLIYLRITTNGRNVHFVFVAKKQIAHFDKLTFEILFLKPLDINSIFCEDTIEKYLIFWTMYLHQRFSVIRNLFQETEPSDQQNIEIFNTDLITQWHNFIKLAVCQIVTKAQKVPEMPRRWTFEGTFKKLLRNFVYSDERILRDFQSFSAGSKFWYLTKVLVLCASMSSQSCIQISSPALF